MRILMVNPHDIYFEPWTTRPVRLAEAFARMGHEVLLCYSPLPSESRRYPRTRVSEPEGVRLKGALLRGWAVAKNVKALLPLARDADVVQFQKSLPYCCVPALVCARLCNKPVCYDWDDNESEIVREWAPSATFAAAVYAVERLVPRWVTTITVSSRALREKCISVGVDEQLIFDAPVGARLEDFDPTADGHKIRSRYGITGPLVMYMGQLQGASYGELFLRAAEIVASKNRSAWFMVVGGGNRLEALKSAASMLGLGGRIIFTDYVPHEAVPGYLAAADVAVATFEPNATTVCKSPLKIAEYMAAGRPIVASDVGEVQRMVGQAGLVVEPDNPHAIAEAVMRLLQDTQLARKLGALGRRRAEEIYNWEATARSVLRALETAVQIGPFRRRLWGVVARLRPSCN